MNHVPLVLEGGLHRLRFTDQGLDELLHEERQEVEQSKELHFCLLALVVEAAEESRVPHFDGDNEHLQGILGAVWVPDGAQENAH